MKFLIFTILVFMPVTGLASDNFIEYTDKHTATITWEKDWEDDLIQFLSDKDTISEYIQKKERYTAAYNEPSTFLERIYHFFNRKDFEGTLKENLHHDLMKELFHKGYLTRSKHFHIDIRRKGQELTDNFIMSILTSSIEEYEE